ncbi:hypothetical protein ABPG77_010372 [Micractinium sp. CCAP 211/92]
MTPALCEWLAVRQPTIATPVLPLEPPPLQPQQAPAIPSNSPAMPLALPLPPAQQAAVLQLLQQLLLPALAVPPQTSGAAHAWQQAWQPAAAGSSNSEAPPEHPAGPEAGAEAEAAAAAAAVLALAAEASSSGTATAEPAACPARSASPPPHLVPRDDAPLPFQPRSTQSVQAALAAPLPRGQAIRGARDQSGVWQAWIHYSKKQAFVGRLSRQAAAVAADLVLAWQRRCLTAKVAEKAATRQYNIPAVRYESDAELMAQLSLVASPEQMKQFLLAVIPQAPPQPHPPQAAVGVRTRQRKRGGGSAGSAGSKRRRLGPTDSEEAMPAQLQAVAGAAASPSAAFDQDQGQQQVLQAAVHAVSKAHARKQAAPRRAPTPESATAARDAADGAFKDRRSDDEASAADF